MTCPRPQDHDWQITASAEWKYLPNPTTVVQYVCRKCDRMFLAEVPSGFR